MASIFSRLFSSRSAESPRRPEWATFFTNDQYTHFIALVNAYFRDRGKEFQFDGSFVTVPSRRKEPRRLGVLNLAQKCAKLEEAAWKSIVDGHFDRSESVEEQMAPIRAEIHDFSAVRDKLAVQLYPCEACVDDAVVCREDLPGLRSVLVFDVPAATQQVSRVDASGWGKNWDELFEIGIGNVFTKYKPKNNNLVKLGEVASVVVFEGDEFFASTFALLVAKRKDLIGPAGTLVSVPKSGVIR